MLNILGRRYLFFGISLLIIIPGLVILAIWGAPMSVDFAGGTLIEVQFTSGTIPQTADMVSFFDGLGIPDVTVQTTQSADTLVIRASKLDLSQRTQIIDAMQTRFNVTVNLLKFDTVGPSISQEVTSRGAIAVAVSAIGVVLYIFFAFRKIPNSFRYGVCAIIATIHDVLIMISIAGIGCKFFGWSIDSMYLTALLTVIGFSTQDTIVVFDRIRENNAIYRKLNFETLVNHSIVQTLQRSINTQLMTSEFLLLAVALLGGVTLREFAIVLFLGLLSGTYSSIFIAAPVLVVWENKEWKTWFKKNKASEA